MNSIQLSGTNNIPLTSDLLAFMQASYTMLEKLSALGGDNYILKGCTVTGSSVSDGWVVLNGLLMPFKGGSIQENVRIVTTVNNYTVGGGSESETSINAEFGTSTNPAENVAWDVLNVNRLASLLNLGGRMGGAETTLNSLTERMLSAENDIRGANGLNTRMQTAEGDIDGHETRIAANYNKLLSMPYVVGRVFIETDGTILEQSSNFGVTFSVTKHGAGSYCITHNLNSGKYIAIAQVAFYDLGTPNDTPTFTSVGVWGLQYTRDRVTVQTGYGEGGDDARIMVHLLKTDNGDLGFYA